MSVVYTYHTLYRFIYEIHYRTFRQVQQVCFSSRLRKYLYNIYKYMNIILYVEVFIVKHDLTVEYNLSLFRYKIIRASDGN